MKTCRVAEWMGGYLFLVYVQEVAASHYSKNVRRRTQDYSVTNPEFKPLPQVMQSDENLLDISPVYEMHQDFIANECVCEKKEFEGVCVHFLLSKHVTWDELISQHDYASFLASYCVWKGKCSVDKEFSFETLPIALQLAFTRYLCTCDESLCQVEGKEIFGLKYNSLTKELVKSQILSMCDSLFPDVRQYITQDQDCDEVSCYPTSSESSSHSPIMSPSIYSIPPWYVQRPVSIASPTYTEESPHQGGLPSVPIESPIWAPTQKIPKTKSPKPNPDSPIFETTASPAHLESPNLYITTENPTASPSPMEQFTKAPTNILSSTPSIITGTPTYSSIPSITSSSPKKSASPSISPSIVPSSSPSKEETMPPMIADTSIAPSMAYWFQPSLPSMSSTPSLSETSDSLFINEFGEDFIEVAYSSSSDISITKYELVFYGSDALMLTSSQLSNGNPEINGLTLTFKEFPESKTRIKAVALVNSGTQNVLQFLSKKVIIKASNGPAESLISTDIWTEVGSNPDLPLFQGQKYSVSLLGTGCTFSAFNFAITNATPGKVNFGQEISDCNITGPGVPSPSPSILIRQGISNGAIIGLSASIFLLITIYLMLIYGGKSRENFERANARKVSEGGHSIKVEEASSSNQAEVALERSAKKRKFDEDIHQSGKDSFQHPANTSLSIIDGLQDDSVDSPADISQGQEDVSRVAGSVSSATKKTPFSFLRNANKRLSQPNTTQPSLIVSNNDAEIYDSILLDEDSTRTVGESTSPGEKEPSTHGLHEENDFASQELSESDCEDALPTIADNVTSRMSIWPLSKRWHYHRGKTSRYPKKMFTPNTGELEDVEAEKEMIVAADFNRAAKSRFHWRLPQKKDVTSGCLEGIEIHDDLLGDSLHIETTSTKKSSWPLIKRRVKASNMSQEVKSTGSGEINKVNIDNVVPPQRSAILLRPPLILSSSPIDDRQSVSQSTEEGQGQQSIYHTKENTNKDELTKCENETHQGKQEDPTLSGTSNYVGFAVDSANASPTKIKDDAVDIAFKFQDDDSDVSSVYLPTDYEVRSLPSDTDSMSLNSTQAITDGLDGLENALEHHDWNAIYNITKKVRSEKETEMENDVLLAGLPNTELVDSTADLVNEPLGYLDDKLIAKGSEDAVLMQEIEHTDDDDEDSVEWIGFYRPKTSFPRISDETGEENIAESIPLSRVETQHVVRQNHLGPIMESIQAISSRLEHAYFSDNTSTIPLGDTSTETQLTKLIESKDWSGLSKYSTQEEIVNERELQSIEATRLVDDDTLVSPYWNFGQKLEETIIPPEDLDIMSNAPSESN